MILGMDDTQRIKTIISDELGIAVRDLVSTADLRDDLNAEDLEIADLLTKLEQVFSHRLDYSDISRIRTVGDVIELFHET